MLDFSQTTSELATLVVDGFEHLGPITVRPRTVGDTMLKIPGLVDQLLGSNMNPSAQSRYNALMIAIAQHAIVYPDDLVDRVLASNDPRDLQAELPVEEPKPGGPKTFRTSFFEQFAKEYGDWCEGKVEEARLGNSGKGSKGTGKKSASTSETIEDSSPLTLVG